MATAKKPSRPLTVGHLEDLLRKTPRTTKLYVVDENRKLRRVYAIQTGISHDRLVLELNPASLETP